MKAAYNEKYGPATVLTVRDIPRPQFDATEILVKVHASSVTTADWRLRASAFPLYAWLPGRLMFGLFKPKLNVLGADFAGEVVAVGDTVTRLKAGDKVFGSAGMGMGAHAEYLKVPETGAIDLIPDGISFEEAAAVPFGALCALEFLRDVAKVKPGQNVLVNGASGGVGVFAVQLAKHFGANVTGVCSKDNFELVRSLGADQVVDYKTENFTDRRETYDLIFDTIGTTSFQTCKPVLSANGILLPIEIGLREIMQSLLTCFGKGQKVKIGISGDALDDLKIIRDLLDQRIIKPVIDSRYSLENIADAHRRVESRHKNGSVILTLVPPVATIHAVPQVA